MISGWLDCPAFGEPIDRIIPSKVPLDETFNESVPPGKRYSSKQVINKQRKAGREVSIVLLIISSVYHTCVLVCTIRVCALCTCLYAKLDTVLDF